MGQCLDARDYPKSLDTHQPSITNDLFQELLSIAQLDLDVKGNLAVTPC
ncbi:MAG: hypothetical protein ACTSUE_27455 [Promethearchaeota archaeon]